MKLTKAKNAKKLAVAKKKPSFDFKSFWNSVNSLNKDNYGSAPLAVKIFVVLMMVAILAVAAWLVFISKKLDEIGAAENEKVTLLQQYQEKESKARHLQEYEDQVAQMQVDFEQLLNQLPKDTRVSDLIEGINMRGVSSGLRFQDISVEPEIEQEFFIEQPISITGIGDYHQFGDFMTGIAALPRIITMHDFEVKNQKPTLDQMPELQMVLHTKTYRAKVATEQDAATPDANAANAGGQQ